jgi:hypothetical protein
MHCQGIGGDFLLLENYKHPDLLFPHSQRKVELDLYIPSLKLAFEYQGAQHEVQTHRGDFRRQVERDNEKKQLCKKHGVTLICIPYQWSGLDEDLVATIHHYRPDIQLSRLVNKGHVILPGQARKAFKRLVSKSSVPFMLSQVYRHVLDPTNWCQLSNSQFLPFQVDIRKIGWLSCNVEG